MADSNTTTPAPNVQQTSTTQLVLIIVFILIVFVGIMYLRFMDFVQSTDRYKVESETALAGLNIIAKQPQTTI